MVDLKMKKMMLFLSILIIIYYPLYANGQTSGEPDPRLMDALDLSNFSEQTKKLIKIASKELCIRPYEEGVIPKLGYYQNPIEVHKVESNGTMAEIIDYNRFTCIEGFHDFSGSAGAPLKLVINGKIINFGHHRSWEVVDYSENQPVLLVSRHGLWCDRAGYRMCISAYVYEEGEFAHAKN